jgi:hypothetical protein
VLSPQAVDLDSGWGRGALLEAPVSYPVDARRGPQDARASYANTLLSLGLFCCALSPGRCICLM